MFSFEEYITAWGVYMVSALVLMLVFWQMTKRIPWHYPKQILRLIVASLLLTPSLVENSTVHWSPAWIKGLLHLIFSGTEGFFAIGKVLLMGVLVSILVFLLLTLGKMFYTKQVRSKSSKA